MVLGTAQSLHPLAPSGASLIDRLGHRGRADEGSRSLGLSTKVLPQATAKGNIQQGTMQGKLNGVMPALEGAARRSHGAG